MVPQSKYREQVSLNFDVALRNLILDENGPSTAPYEQRLNAWASLREKKEGGRGYNRISTVLYAELPVLLAEAGITFVDALRDYMEVDWPSDEIRDFYELVKQVPIPELSDLELIADTLCPVFWEDLRDISERPSERVRRYRIAAAIGERKDRIEEIYYDMLYDGKRVRQSNETRSFPTERLAELANAFEIPFQWVFGGYGEIPVSHIPAPRQRVMDGYMKLEPADRRLLEEVARGKIGK